LGTYPIEDPPKINNPNAVDAHQWFEVEDEVLSPVNICDVIQEQLKVVKKFHTAHTFKAFTNLTAVLQYVKLREHYEQNLCCTQPCMSASLAIARCCGKANSVYFARQICANKWYLLKHCWLPPSEKDGLHGQITLLDSESVVLGIHRYLAAQSLGTITVQAFCRHINEVISSTLGLTGQSVTISECTARNWLQKLEYSCVEVRKCLYHPGRSSWRKWLSTKSELAFFALCYCHSLTSQRLMYTYNDITMEPILPTLGPGQKLHILLPQDKCITHVNETPHKVWLQNGKQPLRKKGNGRAIMISDWIIETCGRLHLLPEQIAHQVMLPEASRLHVTDARQIIYPGKNHNKWWDLAQLKEQLKEAVDIFEYLPPDAVAIWVFDCSLSHEGLASDPLNVHNMNVHPGRKQTQMHNTIVPLNNPPPKDGMFNT
jgi:hypothetical protein